MLGLKVGRWRLLALVVGLFLVVAVGACGGDNEDEAAAGGAERIRLALVPAATLLPSMVAEEEGIFERNGLDVSITFIQNLATLPGAMGRQFDLGPITGPDVIKANRQGINVVLASGGAKDNLDLEVSGVLAPQDSGIDGPRDLEGKTVGGGSLGGNIHPSTLFWMMRNGANPERTKFVEVPHPNQLDQLKGDRIDAVEALEPFKSGMIKELGAKLLVDPMDAVMNEAGIERISFVDFMAEKSWAEENLDVIERFVKSHQEATDFIKQNEARAREIFREQTKVPPEVAETILLPEFSTAVSASELEAWAMVLKEIGQVPPDFRVSVDDLVVTPEENLEE